MSRKTPFLTIVLHPYKKMKINLSGCNFSCKGCFAIAKEEKGRRFSVNELIRLIVKSSHFVLGKIPEDVQMTGGEPTLDQDYLVLLIQRIRELGVERVGISTNGHLLNRDFVKILKSLNVDYIKLDIKAYSEKIHRWYTGEDNSNVLRATDLLNEYGLNFYTRTIFIPGIIDVGEIEKISRFLAKVNKEIPYRIYQFVPDYVDNDDLRKRPDQRDLLKAFHVAKEYIQNVEFCVAETTYDPNYRFVEVRADEVMGDFKRVDRIVSSGPLPWKIHYFTMDEIIGYKGEWNEGKGCLS